jgi:hypothetical protein
MADEQKARVGGPVLFSDVGKQAKDLVNSGFVGGHTLMLSSAGPRAATITTTATIVQYITVGIVQATFQEGNTTHTLSFATTGNQVSVPAISLLLRIILVLHQTTYLLALKLFT